MRYILFTLILILFYATPSFAQFIPPTQDEIEEQALQSEVSAIFDRENDNIDYNCTNPLNPVKFPDGTRLMACVVNNDIFSRFPTSCGEAVKVRHLTCNDDNLSSLEGIQQFPNLESVIIRGLKAGGSQVKSLAPLRNLVNLYRIEVPSAEIESVAYLSRLPKLEYLDLSKNKITDLRFFRLMKSVRSLSLQRQTPPITDISVFAKVNSLRIVKLDSNMISDIAPITASNGIETLTFNDNRVTSLEPLRNLPHLYMLEFNLNLIRDISPLATTPSLAGVHGVFNRITDVTPLANLNQLVQADFRQNFITSVEPFRNMKSILSIMLDYNLITSLEPIYMLRTFSKVNELGFAYNCIPQTEFDKIWYREQIQTKRYMHQCEIPHSDNETFDLSNVVNKDIVNYKNASNFDEIFFNVDNAVGCSVGNGSVTSFTIELAFLLGFIFRRKFYIK